MRAWGGTIGLALLAGCGGLVDGNDQTILLISTPPGAACGVARGGAPLAAVAMTPMSVTVPTSPHPLTVTCRTTGLPPATVEVASTNGIGTFGARFAGGQMGRAIDRATLTEFRYPGTILVDVAPPGPRVGPLPLAH